MTNQTLKKYPRVTKGNARELEKMANDLIRDGYSIEKDSRHSDCKTHKGLVVGTVVINAHNYRFRFWIDQRYGKGTLKVQPK